MFRELVIAAAIAGSALTVAPSAAADGDQQSYAGDVPGIIYGVNLSTPCYQWDKFRYQ